MGPHRQRICCDEKVLFINFFCWLALGFVCMFLGDSDILFVITGYKLFIVETLITHHIILFGTPKGLSI